jgi:AbrB family looped-hinge helix DNA binding protein
MSYSKITKKGQITVPVKYRRKYNLTEGVVVEFEGAEGELIIRPVPDISDSAGSLSKYADPKELLADLMKAREEPFR